jgi:hypothetical protein
MMRALFLRSTAGLLALAFAAGPLSGQEKDTPHPKPVPPVDPAVLEASIERGIAFLLQRQNPDGSWGSARNTKDLNIYAPVPGAHNAFRAAVTAMAINALIATGAIGDDPAALTAVERAETWLFANLPRVRRAEGAAIYNVWTHIYSIQALAAMHGRPGIDDAKKEQIRKLISDQIGMLERYESVDGGWGYYDFRFQTKKPSSSSISFVSAAGLVAFHDAREIGVAIPEKLAQRALAAIQRQRKNDNTYAYGEYLAMRPMYPINRAGGSLGRSQSCNIALLYWGDESITQKVLDTWLDRLIARNMWLDIGRKRPVPHESWFAVAGYFYYFGHYYAARCIEQVEDVTRANEHRDQLATTVMSHQEKDGSWWDFPFYDYHQQYGTAFALMTLEKCRKPRPAAAKKP